MSTETPTDNQSTNEAAESEGVQTSIDDNASWEDIGRDLLHARLERISEETVRDAFRQATSRIAAGEALTEEDIVEMYTAIEEAKRGIELAAAVSPETEPFPDPYDFLRESDRQRYIEEAERRRDV